MADSDPIYLSDEPDKNFIIPFQIEKLPVRGRFVRLNSVVNTILHRHNYPRPVALLLAECLALGAAIAHLFKSDGMFTLQTNSDGPIKMLVADMTSTGELRGYAEFDDATFKTTNGHVPNFQELVGQGYLAFTVDPGQENMERYQGIVDLTGESLSECIEHYFNQSMQVPTTIMVACDERQDPTLDSVWRSSCMLLQRMPVEAGHKLYETLTAEELDDGWHRSNLLLKTVKQDELVGTEVQPEDLLYQLFHEDGIITFDKQTPTVGCRCSRERIKDVLSGLSPDDLDASIEDDKITVTCQFCNTDYEFNKQQISALKRAYKKKHKDASS